MYPNENTCMCNHDIPLHTNAFIDLNGMPFLLAEYLDRRNYQQLDRSMIYNEINVDSHESMRAIVNINIDDIGKRTDGLPNVIGNNTKQHNLIHMIIDNYMKLDHHLPVIKPGICLCINYQLENNRTGQIIRAAQEKIFIKDRIYFLDINPMEINDNAIVCNFSQSCVSSLTEFTHGRDPMIFRITSIQMFYQVVSPEPVRPTPEALAPYPTRVYPPMPERESMYAYHSRMQNRHYIGDYSNERPDTITPPHWGMMNRLYHFENMGRDIVLHYEELMHPRNHIIDVPCGRIDVNRTFFINPGHRIIWKISIWKNDVTSVNDTTEVATSLRAPCYDDCHHCHDPHAVMDVYNASVAADYEQNAVINQLAKSVADLTTAVAELKNGTSETPVEIPVIPELPTGPTCNCPPPPPPCHPHHPHHPHHPPHDPIHGIMNQINEIREQISDMSDDMVDETELNAISNEGINNILQDAISSVPDIDDTNSEVDKTTDESNNV